MRIFELGLVAHQTDGLGRRADEGQPGIADGLGKVRVFGEKAVAGMDGVHALVQRGGEELFHVQVGLARRGRADQHGFFGVAHVQRVRVRFGVDRHGADAEFLAGADDPDGDFAAVDDEDFGEGRVRHGNLDEFSMSDE